MNNIHVNNPNAGTEIPRSATVAFGITVEPRFTTKSGQVRFGMGIGMGISLSIVGKHHGTMRATSRTKPPSGTTVTIDLPAAQPKEEQ